MLDDHFLIHAKEALQEEPIIILSNTPEERDPLSTIDSDIYQRKLVKTKVIVWKVTRCDNSVNNAAAHMNASINNRARARQLMQSSSSSNPPGRKAVSNSSVKKAALATQKSPKFPPKRKYKKRMKFTKRKNVKKLEISKKTVQPEIISLDNEYEMMDVDESQSEDEGSLHYGETMSEEENHCSKTMTEQEDQCTETITEQEDHSSKTVSEKEDDCISELCEQAMSTEEEESTELNSEAAQTEQSKDKELREYECLKCDETFATKAELMKHEKEEVHDIYECMQCDDTFVTEAELVKHEKDKRHETPSMCFRCKKVFRSASALGIHASTNCQRKGVDPQETEYMLCRSCGYVAVSQDDFRNHNNEMHVPGRTFSCSQCGEKFSKNAELLEHQQKEKHKNRYICEVCGKIFPCNTYLTTHSRLYHFPGAFPCPHCRKSMSTDESLQLHIKNVHKDFVCQECGKVLSKASSLNLHMLTHQKDRVKKHICQVCSKAFSKKDSLNQHLLLHTGKKYYSCDLCGKEFAQKPGLSYHRKKVHSKVQELPKLANTPIVHLLQDFMSK